MHDSVPTLTPDEVADLVAKGIIEKPSRIATRLASSARWLTGRAEGLRGITELTASSLFPDSAAAKGDKKALKGETAPSNEQIVFTRLTRVHYASPLKGGLGWG